MLYYGCSGSILFTIIDIITSCNTTNKNVTFALWQPITESKILKQKPDELIWLFVIESVSPGHIQYCRDHYANSHCEQGCDSAPCGWDGSDCFTQQAPAWAKGTVVLHARIPHQRGSFSNSSLLWALSILLQTPLKLRGTAPLATTRKLQDFTPQQLESILADASAADSNGWVTFYWLSTGQFLGKLLMQCCLIWVQDDK